MTDVQVVTAVVTAAVTVAQVTVVLEEDELRLRHDEARPPLAAEVTREMTEVMTVDDRGHPSGEMTDDDRGRQWAADGAVEACRRMETLMRLMLSELMMLSMTTSGVKPVAMRGTSRRCRSGIS